MRACVIILGAAMSCSTPWSKAASFRSACLPGMGDSRQTKRAPVNSLFRSWSIGGGGSDQGLNPGPPTDRPAWNRPFIYIRKRFPRTRILPDTGVCIEPEAHASYGLRITQKSNISRRPGTTKKKAHDISHACLYFTFPVPTP